MQSKNASSFYCRLFTSESPIYAESETTYNYTFFEKFLKIQIDKKSKKKPASLLEKKRVSISIEP